MAGASVESCRFVVLRSPWCRLGSVLYTCNRLHRMRGRFHRWIHISTGPQPQICLEHKNGFAPQHERISQTSASFRPRGQPTSPDTSDRFPSQHALRIPLSRETELNAGAWASGCKTLAKQALWAVVSYERACALIVHSAGSTHQHFHRCDR